MMNIRLALIIAASAGLTLASASASAKTLLAEGPQTSVVSLTATDFRRATAGGSADSHWVLSDRQMDKVAAGLGFDLQGYNAAFSAWLSNVQAVLATYTGVETHLPLLTGCGSV